MTNQRQNPVWAYIKSVVAPGIKPGLERVHKIMDLLGNPEKQFKSIHVAGTNGKGSTCAMITQILIEAGFKTGLHTGPHMVTFNERIQINNKNISDEELYRLVEQVRQVNDEYNIGATYFEFITAMALLHYAQEKVDFGVIEVGMGGLLDGTNVITPEVSVITNISMDHMEYLGNTKAEIAFQKAGIIKKGVPVVTHEQDPEALDVITAQAKKMNAELISAQPTEYKTILRGEHQKLNAATAVTAIRVLQQQGGAISEEHIRQGLLNVFWPGRLQLISEHPTIYVDGAHNEDGWRVLAEFLKTLPQRDILMIAVKKGKAVEHLQQLVIPLFKKVIITDGSFESMATADLAKVIQHDNVEIVPGIANGYKALINQLQSDQTAVITGSLYAVGDVLGLKK